MDMSYLFDLTPSQLSAEHDRLIGQLIESAPDRCRSDLQKTQQIIDSLMTPDPVQNVAELFGCISLQLDALESAWRDLAAALNQLPAE